LTGTAPTRIFSEYILFVVLVIVVSVRGLFFALRMGADIANTGQVN
jgi:hypothetical protein